MKGSDHYYSFWTDFTRITDGCWFVWRVLEKGSFDGKGRAVRNLPITEEEFKTFNPTEVESAALYGME